MIDYKKKFDEALSHTYVAAMFDIDGTLIETGSYEFSAPVAKEMAELSMKIPVAICSGRRLEGLMEMMSPIFEATPNLRIAQKNWTLFIENGAIGMKWNEEKDAFEKFYQIDWPHEKISMEAVMKRLQEELPSIFPEVMFRMNECNLGIYIPHRDHYQKEALAHLTSTLAVAMRAILPEFKGAEQVKVIDSGVAVHILPIDGDKDRGIREFARILGTGPEAREILIIGDQPCAGCNDEKFLEGTWGTPFTAEHLNPGHIYPIPIFDEKGKILTGPEATVSLLKRVKWAN